MRISSANPPPHAVVPDPTPSAIAPHSTSTTATPEPQQQQQQQQQQRAERTDMRGTPIKPGNSSQKTSLSRSALDNLPNELLMEIVQNSSNSSLLALRGVSKHLHSIANANTSAPQNFILAKGAALQAMGHAAVDMHKLAARPAIEQDFVIKYGAALKKLKFGAVDMHKLATRPVIEQEFVLKHGATLQPLKLSAELMLYIAARPAAVQAGILERAAAG